MDGWLGSFSPSATTLNATYTPTAAEISNGSVTLTLTSTGNGNCVSVSDAMTIFLPPQHQCWLRYYCMCKQCECKFEW
ncbi:MAG: hypothetical protein R2809_15005 [Flavobacteriales bacterium]